MASNRRRAFGGYVTLTLQALQTCVDEAQLHIAPTQATATVE